MLTFGWLLFLLSVLTPGTVGYERINDAVIIAGYFPEYERDTAVQKFYCETKFDRYQVGASGERGIPQIGRGWWLGWNGQLPVYRVTGDDLLNPHVAGWIASDIQSKYGWSPWSC